MTWQPLTYRFTSSAPLLMHCGQTADPLNKFSKLLKRISGKKTKTDADREEMAHIEFIAGLYMDADGPIIPNTVIDAMTVRSAMKMKEGQVAKSGVFCLQHARLDYDGPRTAEGLWEDERFRFVAGVKVGQARVMPTRPMFTAWSLEVTVQIEDSLVNPEQVDRWMQIAGMQIGLCDWRPQYGRFTAVRVKALDKAA